MHLPKFGQIASVSDRRLVGGPATQALLPLKYSWLYNTYKTARNNFWQPQEVPCGDDKRDYPRLPPNVKHQYDWLFSMLTTMDLVVVEAVDVSVMRHATAPELRQWLALQGFQEAIHTDSYVLLTEEIGLDQDQVFNRYLQEESLYNKVAMAGKYSAILDGITDLSVPGQMEQFIVSYAFFPLILESLWFYMGLSAGTYATRFEGKMQGTNDQFSLIRRDESLHYSVGLTVLADIIKENPQIDHEYVSSAILEMAVRGLKLEDAFARFTYRDLPGMGADAYLEHCRFQMKLGLRRLGLALPDCDDATPALPWVSETVELRRETNFFERRLGEYQVGVSLFAEFSDLPDSGGNDLWDNPV